MKEGPLMLDCLCPSCDNTNCHLSEYCPNGKPTVEGFLMPASKLREELEKFASAIQRAVNGGKDGTRR